MKAKARGNVAAKGKALTRRWFLSEFVPASRQTGEGSRERHRERKGAGAPLFLSELRAPTSRLQGATLANRADSLRSKWGTDGELTKFGRK